MCISNRITSRNQCKLLICPLPLSQLKNGVIKSNNEQQILIQQDEKHYINLDGNNKQRTKKKAVTFKETVYVRSTISRKDLTQEELSKIWYHPKEFEEIRCKVAMLARKVQRDGAQLSKDKRYCTRGLESILTGRAERKLHARSDVWNAVIFEQDRQFLSNFLDVGLLAFASQKFSSESRLLALAVGRMDEKEAENIYRR
jgi:hypothetical protein